MSWVLVGNFSGCEGVWGTCSPSDPSLGPSIQSVQRFDPRRTNSDIHRESREKSPVTQSKDGCVRVVDLC